MNLIDVKYNITYQYFFSVLNHSHKKRKDSLETRAERAVFVK